MVAFHAHYTSSFEILVEAVALLQCRDISHLFRHVSVVWGNFPCASWCHLCHAEDRQRHCLTWQVTKSQWVQSQRWSSNPAHGLQALCHTSGPCFSVHHYHQNQDRKTNNSRQEQRKLALSKVSCWCFPWLERLGYERIFSPFTQTSS